MTAARRTELLASAACLQAASIDPTLQICPDEVNNQNVRQT
jgi:hypothetical protein